MKKLDLSLRSGRARWLPFVLIAAVVVLWLAPITLFGRMPIGGDVTSFFLPLMSYYRRALLDGRVPLWNELWGFGFPMLAESQAGVFYPPHLILYRLFEVETAYSLNIVLHHVLAGWFAYICGRTFGLKPWGATLAGLVFAGNGFFIIHFPHQWSYTTGCWLPLAVALAWQAVGNAECGVRSAECRTIEARGPIIESAGRRRARAALGLTAVLAVQMLAGHFQIAFYTQIVVLLIGVWCSLHAVFPRIRRAWRRPQVAPPARSSILYPRSSILWIGLSVFCAFILAAGQILPTYELIRIALPEGRDYEYLSGFGNTPFHLVSYLLPTLFHVNPLWRPVAWDAFHTSPEECFSYVGLLPLCLAAGAAWRWRREPRVRLWVLLVVITLLLSLGPYFPLFRGLIRLPGFDGFRSASRWNAATSLFLALLAGKGLDGLKVGLRLRWWLCRFAVAGFIVACAYGSFTQALLHDNVASARSRILETTMSILRTFSPWPKELDEGRFAAQVRASATQLRTVRGLADIGYDLRPRSNDAIVLTDHRLPIRPVSLANERARIMLQEFGPPVVAMVAVCACLAGFCGKRRVPRWMLVLLTSADLGATSWLRPTDFAPRGRLIDQSPTLAFLSQHAPARRVGYFQGNLPMLAGAAEVYSYRTVDIPILQHAYTSNLVMRAGLSSVVMDTVSARLYRPEWDGPGGGVRSWSDALMGRIVFGQTLAQTFPELTTEFTSYEYGTQPGGNVWFVPAGSVADLDRMIGLADFDPHIRQAEPLLTIPGTPLQPIRSEPEFEEVEIDASSLGLVVITSLYFPGWTAELHSADAVKPSKVLRVGSGYRAVVIPAAGSYRLVMRYRSNHFVIGCWVSLAAATVWALGYAALGVAGRRKRARAIAAQEHQS